MHVRIGRRCGMLEDRYGLPLSTSSRAARDAYVEGVDCILSAVGSPEAHLERALEADPDFALAHAALARTLLVAAQGPQARAAATRSCALAERATPREQSHANTLALSIEGRASDALAATRQHLASFPRDAMVLAPAAGVFGLIGFSGRQRREEELLELLRGLAPHYGEDWWFLGVLSFAACECGRIDEAMELIERSLGTNPRNAHGEHFRVHVLYEKGEPELASRRLDDWMRGYAKADLMHCHLSWHAALLALELGRPERAWEIYRADVHPGGAWGPPINLASDAPAFLWRSEMAGQPRRRELWREVHDYVVRTYPRVGVNFIDVHRALTCAATGDSEGIEHLAGALRERLAAGALAAGQVVPTLVEAFGAYAGEDLDLAIALLERALPETVRIGGSRAQRDLVEHTLIAAYLRAGRSDDARRLIAGRTERGPAVNVAGFSPDRSVGPRERRHGEDPH
jgi:tetratricopeptide (TPR) repeat protein